MTIEKRTSYNPRACGALCDECPLKGQTVVPPETHVGARVALIGEAPGDAEEKHGRPFVGPNGTELDRAIRASGHHRGKFHITYTILCKPPENDLALLNRGISKQAKLSGAVMKTPQECCAPRLQAEIASFRDIIPLGKTAMQSVTGSSQSILAVRGALVELESTIRTLPRRVLPTISPGLVQKQQRWAHVFRSDIAKAMRIFNGLSGWTDPDIVYHPSAKEFRQFIDTDIYWTYDIETDGIEPLDANIRCIAIGNEQRVMVIGMRSNAKPKDAKGLFLDFYEQEEASAMLQELRYFFENENIHKIGHNSGSYDRTVIRQRLGMDVKPNIDTIMIHRNVDPEMPHSLAYVASLYTDAPAWKCYDKETEILTERGWVKFDDLCTEDKVAQWNEGRVEFVVPLNLYKADYTGPMLHFVNQATDLMVTPDHKMLFRKKGQSKNLICMAQELAGTELLPSLSSDLTVVWCDLAYTDIASVDYEGTIHCVSVPSGFVVVRRNGKVVVSGNSDREGNKIAHGGENDHQLHEYAAKDVAVTARVLSPLLDALGARDQLEVYKLDMRIQEICMVMHTTGMFVDQAIRHKKEVELLTLRHNLLSQIRDMTEIKHFNPASVNHLRDLLFDRWKLSTEFIDEEDRFTESGDLSTGDYILRGLLTDGQIEEVHRSVIKLIRRYRKCQKVLGTYVVKLRPSNMGADLGWDEDEDWVDKETRKQYGEEKRGIVNPLTGRMYPGYSAHIAATGRLSSSKPINCFDAETEILTEIGWVRFDTLLESHRNTLKVAQWHENGSIDFVVPSAYHTGHHRGEMVAYKSQSADLFMTPNHRIPLVTNDRKVVTVTAEKLYQIVRTKHFEGLATLHAGNHVEPVDGRNVAEKVPFSDQVYCVTVASDAIVVRRNGKVTITRQSQNFPKAMRSMIVAQPGNVLVGADMDQLELRVAAARWGVELYLRAFREGKDPHGMTAYAVFGNDFCRAAGVDPSCYRGNGMLVGKAYDEKGKFIGKGEAKTFRDLSKGVQYCSQYMGSAETTHKLIRKTEVPAVHPETKEPLNDGTTDLPYARLPLQKVRVMQENWLRGAPQFKTGWQSEIETYRKKGYLREPVTGRRRDFLDGEKANEIVNFPIQCVPGNTRVITQRGYIQIQELEGLAFQAWTGKKWALATCIRKGKAELFKVKTNHAVSLICDGSHQLLEPARSEYSWKSVRDMQAGERVALTLAVPLEFGTHFDDEDMYVLGLFVADGCLTRRDKGRARSVSLSFALGKKNASGPAERSGIAIVSKIEQYLTKNGLSPRTEEKEGYSIVSATKGVSYWADRWGLSAGLKARDKRIPEIVWRSSLENRKSFIRGVLDGDGYQVPDGAILLNLFNPELLEDIAILARTIGIDAQSLQGPYATNKDKVHVSWRLHLSGEQTAKVLGWGRACKYRSNETLPQFECSRIVERLCPKTASHKTMKSRIRGHGGAKSITSYSALAMGVSDIYDHAHITSVSSIGQESEVYTLCLEDEEHRYVANGFVSKNSSAAAIMNLAMVRLYEEVPLHKWGPGTGIINQCHDAIVIECPEGEGERVARLLEQCMNQVHDTLPGVEFTASADIGKSWDKV